MSRRLRISAKKLINIEDPELVHSHKEGAVVEMVQPAVDKKWGRYYFNHGRYRNYLMFSIALVNYNKCIKYLEECRRLPIKKDSVRFVETKLRDKLEKSSCQFIVFNKLGFEYLTAEYLPTIKRIKDHRDEAFLMPREDSSLLDKINVLIRGINISKNIPNVIETLINRRDVVEHPTSERLYNCLEDGWKNNHLAWVLSGELEGSMEIVEEFVNSITMSMEKYIKDNPIPGELKLGIRGLRAGEQVKLPN